MEAPQPTEMGGGSGAPQEKNNHMCGLYLICDSKPYEKLEIQFPGKIGRELPDNPDRGDDGMPTTLPSGQTRIP